MNKSAIEKGDPPRTFWKRAPAPRLRPWLTMFMARREISPREAMTVFPNAQPEIFAHFGDSYATDRIVGAALSMLPQISLLPPRTAPYHHVCGPNVDWFLIQLTPLGCRALLGAPLGALAGPDNALQLFCGRDADELFERQAAAATFDDRCRVAEQWVERRLADPEPRAQLLSDLVTIARRRPLADTRAIADALGIGDRRLRQLFCEEMGMSPKHFLSLMRAERLWTRLHPSSGEDGAMLAEYADQSHAAREFKRFTGLTMGTYLRSKADGDGLVNGVRPSA